MAASKTRGGYQILPVDQIEVSPLHDTDVFLVGLGDLGELHGWKIFKKIKNAVKKVGKAIRKIKLKSVFKVALPVAGLVLAPLALAKIPALVSKFGPKLAGLVKGGKTKAQAVRLANGAVKVGLVSPDELAKIQKFSRNPSTPITEALFNQITGSAFSFREAPGAEIKGGELQLPVQDSGVSVSGQDIPLKPSIPIAAIAIGAAALMLMGKRR